LPNVLDDSTTPLYTQSASANGYQRARTHGVPDVNWNVPVVANGLIVSSLVAVVAKGGTIWVSELVPWELRIAAAGAPAVDPAAASEGSTLPVPSIVLSAPEL
jgi:hypothetical protein